MEQCKCYLQFQLLLFITTLNLVTRLHQLCFPNDTLYKSLNMMTPFKIKIITYSTSVELSILNTIGGRGYFQKQPVKTSKYD